MKIKAVWGFRGDAPKLNATSADVKAGEVFDNVDPEYGHALVGKGLVLQIHEGAAPQETKPAKPSETKAGEGSDLGTSTAVADLATGSSGGAGAQAGNDALSSDAGAVTGAATTAGDDVNGPGGNDQGGDDKALLIQQLEAAGVEFDRRWGTTRLAAALADAQQNKDSE